jgi:UDP-glucose 4-epimerase
VLREETAVSVVEGAENPVVSLAGTRLLLTGATGRVGARFLPPLRAAGADIRLMIWGAAPVSPQSKATTVVIGDLSDRQTCEQAVKAVDAVVHIASAFQGISAQGAYDLNYRATAALARAAVAAGVRRFVQMSSYLVYQPGLPHPAREDDPVRPLGTSTYPAAKLGAERAVAESADDGLDVCVLRLGFTYGEGDPHLADAFGWAGTAASAHRLHLVHHADVRQGVLRVLAAGRLPQRVYNLADDAPVTAAELPGYADAFRWPGDTTQWAALAGDESFQGWLDTAASHRDLEFRPIYPSIRDAQQAGQI